MIGVDTIELWARPHQRCHTETVPVGRYQEARRALADVSADYHACVDDSERAAWCGRARLALFNYGALDCSRAREHDRTEHRRAVEALVTRLVQLAPQFGPKVGP